MTSCMGMFLTPEVTHGVKGQRNNPGSYDNIVLSQLKQALGGVPQPQRVGEHLAYWLFS